MFSKVKALFKDEKSSSPSPARGGGGPKIWTMSRAMRERFEKGGCRYNIKVVLRGPRRSGKSALLARLHEHEFSFDDYTPSPEISAATIRYDEEPTGQPQGQQGGAASGGDGVKVDVWDVVDDGIAAPPTSKKGMGGGAAAEGFNAGLLADAHNIDVYRGCHGAIFLVDCRSRASFEYAATEARRVPPTCAVCVALSFTDTPKAGHQVSEREVSDLARTLPRAVSPMIHLASQGKAPERALSIAASFVALSVRTGAGMDLLRSFFSVAVALVRLETLETQMKAVYQQAEAHQALMLQHRAMMLFEEREQAKRAASGEGLVGEEEAAPPPMAQGPPQHKNHPSGGQQSHAVNGAPIRESSGNGNGSSVPPSLRGAPVQQREGVPPAQRHAQGERQPPPPPAAATAAPAKVNVKPPEAQLFGKRVLPPPAAPKRAAPRTEEEERRRTEAFFGDVSDEDDNGHSARSQSLSDDDTVETSPAPRRAGGAASNAASSAPASQSRVSPPQQQPVKKVPAAAARPAPKPSAAADDDATTSSDDEVPTTAQRMGSKSRPPVPSAAPVPAPAAAPVPQPPVVEDESEEEPPAPPSEAEVLAAAAAGLDGAGGAALDKGFFDDDDDDEEEENEKAAPAEDAPTVATNKASTPAVPAPVALASTSTNDAAAGARKDKDADAKPALTVDVSALLAQMQAAMHEGGGGDEGSPSHSSSSKKDKKDKKDKGGDGEKKEKDKKEKDKKDKKKDGDGEPRETKDKDKSSKKDKKEKRDKTSSSVSRGEFVTSEDKSRPVYEDDGGFDEIIE